MEGLEQVEGSHVKLRSYLMMKARPAQCTKVSFAKPGKHGHVKCNIVGQDVLRPDKKYQHMCPGHEMIEVPLVKKFDLIVSDITTSREGKREIIDEIVCLTDDSEEYEILFDPQDDQHKEVVRQFNSLEDDEECVVSIIKATVGEKGKYEWQQRVEKVATRTADD